MQYALIIGGCLSGALIVFLWWRYTSVLRGARQRDERLAKRLDKLVEKIERKESIDVAKVAKLAAKPELRGMLHQMLKYYERLDLFPADLKDIRSQAESRLAHWLMHPNEFGEPPAAIDHVETIRRTLGDGVSGDFLVFRFRYDEGHFAARDGWLLGLAGPFRSDDPPYESDASGFARFGDKFGETKPEVLVDWFMDMAKKKGTDFSRPKT